ncbi:788_t:CDS:2 [Entrophospora sp. SA101]|nr:12239_t:CDS:2 [Entrophospora sp. SA101]CAJ0640753.1 788_t:CDS:2 [Entrophospora sp. SA101]CAJ0906454.1 359_t:CDS:2 [Entrophospora sp. SA101]
MTIDDNQVDVRLVMTAIQQSNPSKSNTSSTLTKYSRNGIPLIHQKLIDRQTFSFSAELISQFDRYRMQMRESIRHEIDGDDDWKVKNSSFNTSNTKNTNNNNDNKVVDFDAIQQQPIITSEDDEHDDDNSTINNNRSINKRKKQKKSTSKLKLCFSKPKKQKRRLQHQQQNDKKSTFNLFKKIFS